MVNKENNSSNSTDNDPENYNLTGPSNNSLKNREENSDHEGKLIINVNEKDPEKLVVELTELTVNEDDKKAEDLKDDPYNWPKKKKWIILTILSWGAITSTISST